MQLCIVKSDHATSHELNETFDRNVKLHMIGAHPEQLVESKHEDENNKKERRT